MFDEPEEEELDEPDELDDPDDDELDESEELDELEEELAGPEELDELPEPPPQPARASATPQAISSEAQKRRAIRSFFMSISLEMRCLTGCAPYKSYCSHVRASAIRTGSI